MILGLPLLHYRGEYIAASEHSMGLTITDRIRIVREGDSSNNVNSCIRLTSNWFATTAHRYMQVVGMPQPFNIEHLRSIS